MQAVRALSAEEQATGSKILIVEDDLDVAEALTDLLESEGYKVWHINQAAGAEDLLDEVHPDLVLLDIMLPDTDGLVLCSELRARWAAPIILLSATQRKSDSIIGLRLGADDFIAKPFDARDLLARLEVLLRRAATRRLPPAPAESYHVGPLTIDVRRRSVTHEDRPIQLTPTEFHLLAALASEAERVFSREDLASRIWGFETLGKSRVVDVHIRRLRQKLDEAKITDPTIVTLRGFGYKLSRLGD